MKTSVIFDFDGTLADTREALLKAYPLIANKHNLKLLSEAELYGLRKLPIKKRLDLLNIPLSKIPVIIHDTRVMVGSFIETCKPYEGIPDLLLSLVANKYKLNIISSNSEDNIRRFLMKHQLTYFDHIIAVNGLFGKHKSIKSMLRKTNTSKSAALYVGDEIRDIDSCKKAGVDIAAVAWGYDSVDMLLQQKPEYLAYEPQDILTILLS